MISDCFERLGRWFCTVFHDRVGWPVHGEYTCLHCLRRHKVDW